MVKLALCCLCKMLHELVYIIPFSRMFKFHVTFGDFKKIVCLEECTYEKLVREICNTMHLDKDGIVRIQLYDDEFCDWVDLADTDYIPEKGRLQVLVCNKSGMSFSKST